MSTLPLVGAHIYGRWNLMPLEATVYPRTLSWEQERTGWESDLFGEIILASKAWPV